MLPTIAIQMDYECTPNLLFMRISVLNPQHSNNTLIGNGSVPPQS